MAILRKWIIISLCLIAAALLAVLVILHVPYSNHVSKYPQYPGVSPNEYTAGIVPIVALSGITGLVTLVATSLYWFIGLSRIPMLHSNTNLHVMRLTLVLVPVSLAVAVPILLYIQDPGIVSVPLPGG